MKGLLYKVCINAPENSQLYHHTAYSICFNSTHGSKKAHRKQHIKLLKKEHIEITTKIEKLMDARINNEIGKDEFTKNKKRLKDRQYEITELIHAYDVTEDELNNRLICFLNIATGASRAFRGLDTHEKREMLIFIFQNLELKEKKLEYTTHYPFNLFADANKQENGALERT